MQIYVGQPHKSIQQNKVPHCAEVYRHATYALSTEPRRSKVVEARAWRNKEDEKGRGGQASSRQMGIISRIRAEGRMQSAVLRRVSTSQCRYRTRTISSPSDGWVNCFVRRNKNVFGNRPQLLLLADLNWWQEQWQNGSCHTPGSFQIYWNVVWNIECTSDVSTCDERQSHLRNVTTCLCLNRWHRFLLKIEEKVFRAHLKSANGVGECKNERQIKMTLLT